MHILEVQPSITDFERCYCRYLISDCPISSQFHGRGQLSPVRTGVTPHMAVVASATEALCRLRHSDDLNFTICQIYIRAIAEHIFLRPSGLSDDNEPSFAEESSLPEPFAPVIESSKARLLLKLVRFKQETVSMDDIKCRLFDEVMKCAERLLRHHMRTSSTFVNTPASAPTMASSEEERDREIKRLLGSIRLSKRPNEFISLSSLF
jgi:hypothetical protein